ncbi:MAG TPA: hypothetical protein VFS39_14000 [Nitrospira sp.]|nr:hypothetical protein [Nitrospira sp.]
MERSVFVRRAHAFPRCLLDLSRQPGYHSRPLEMKPRSPNTVQTILAALAAVSLAACATTQYRPLAEAEKEQVEQLKENVFRVEYQVGAFTPQTRLDDYLKRRCAELTLREGYDYFHLGQRYDVLMLSRRTSMTVTMFKGDFPAGAPDFYDAKTVLSEHP